MKLALKVSSSNPYCDGECEFALVNLTRDLAGVALRRIHVLKEHKKTDESVFETYYWAYHAEYFSPIFAEPPRTLRTSMRTMTEIVEALEVENKEFVTVPDNFEVAVAHIAAVECEQMLVREDSIAFLAIPKHCDFYVTTADIPLSLLDRAAGIN